MPSTSITEEKAALRRVVRARLSAMSPEEREESDGILFRRFLALPEVAAADRILLFYGMGAEPDTARLIPVLLDMGGPPGGREERPHPPPVRHAGAGGGLSCGSPGSD